MPFDELGHALFMGRVGDGPEEANGDSPGAGCLDALEHLHGLGFVQRPRYCALARHPLSDRKGEMPGYIRLGIVEIDVVAVVLAALSHQQDIAESLGA